MIVSLVLACAPSFAQDTASVPVQEPVAIATAPQSLSSDVEARLAAVLATAPERWSRREIARTRGGAPVWLVAWSAAGDAPRPAVFVCADGAQPSAALGLLDALAAAAASDATALGADVYFVPVRDAERPLAGAADDFPEGWLPWTSAARAPLEAPESRGIAQFLVEHREIATVVRIVGGAELAHEPDAPAPGTLALFAASHLGLRTLSVGGERASEDAAAIVKAAQALPRLAAATPHVERLRETLWLVDVPLSNAGAIGTAPDADERWAALRVRAESGGARVVAAAVARAGDGFRALSASSPAFLGQLAPGEVVTVRAIVEGTENALFSLAFDAPRAGSAVLSVPLQ